MQRVPSSAADWCAQANAARQMGRTERAKAGFRAALAIDPGCFPARFGLASTMLDDGDVAGAAAIVERMAADAAGRPDTAWLQVRVAVARGDPGLACDLLGRLLASATLGPEQRAEAFLQRGIALDDLGRTTEAFAAARAGKQIQRALHAAQAESRESEVAKLERLATWMRGTPSRCAPSPRPPAARAAATHVFLLGFPRSGTTLLEQVLAAHPRVATLEEAPTLAAAYQAFLSDADACAALLRLGDEEATAWAEHYWREIAQRGVDVAGRLFVDKQPAGTLSLPIIARLFPHAKILFALRDPRDVVLSCFRQAFQMNAMTYAFTDLTETAACYDACMRLAQQARARLPLAWCDVRHEALVEDFEGELARITGFLGLEADPAMSDFARAAHKRTIRTPSAPQVRAGLNRRGLGRWEAYREALAPVMPTLAPWVERFGYTV
uniref:tetratricopeptide repeat-containing sulfotransferase family protein n=1 Tax=uncultured Sphingomonas sp. TaxID=158754 RepID=UPI0035C96E3C